MHGLPLVIADQSPSYSPRLSDFGGIKKTALVTG